MTSRTVSRNERIVNSRAAHQVMPAQQAYELQVWRSALHIHQIRLQGRTQQETKVLLLSKGQPSELLPLQQAIARTTKQNNCIVQH
jgi:hypothetical protein